jgi:hypothetical protein
MKEFRANRTGRQGSDSTAARLDNPLTLVAFDLEPGVGGKTEDNNQGHCKPIMKCALVIDLPAT